jgi:hypothetical protein
MLGQNHFAKPKGHHLSTFVYTFLLFFFIFPKFVVVVRMEISLFL